ncbi:AAA family ATPase [uncultured Leptotrichia sp.]|uniref:AAA family ATPase n=1 Tax=uncultured Leptotrichia sp. TaxID=159271 RepID=UPI0025E57D6C|nr:AAA family ATPase [uncultured Leptotrichia sp.]
MSEFVFDYKIYGLQEDFINHVIKTYNEAQTGNLGILLNGTKGTGKTVAAKMIANRLHLPVIIVQNMGQEMNLQMMNYLSTEINFDCVFFFD